MTPNPYQQYRATRVATASPVDQVIMLYQGVAQFAQRGIMAVERGDVAEAHNNFARAQDIVAELIASLDFEQGGEVARNLVALYDFAYRRLVEANVRKAVPPAAQVVQMFRELGSAWQEVASPRARAVAGRPLAALSAVS